MRTPVKGELMPIIGIRGVSFVVFDRETPTQWVTKGGGRYRKKDGRLVGVSDLSLFSTHTHWTDVMDSAAMDSAKNAHHLAYQSVKRAERNLDAARAAQAQALDGIADALRAWKEPTP